ncbi:Uncharacterized protein LC1Hm_2322 [Halomicrobium sp. LC1Hm]|nr:Uncharacterized protein LC1Hm_2322 [Halomicrobium sp. LC1Hm]
MTLPAVVGDTVSSAASSPTASRVSPGEASKTLPTEDDHVKDFEREQLLERIGRESATVGVDIPEAIEVQGETIELQSFVFEIKRRDTIPAGERERVENAKRNLRRERRQRTQRIEDDDITFAQGERLANSIIGIDRALNALEQLGPADIEQEAQAKEAADKKRWMQFLKKALGHEDADSGTGRASRGR